MYKISVDCFTAERLCQTMHGDHSVHSLGEQPLDGWTCEMVRRRCIEVCRHDLCVLSDGHGRISLEQVIADLRATNTSLENISEEQILSTLVMDERFVFYGGVEEGDIGSATHVSAADGYTRPNVDIAALATEITYADLVPSTLCHFTFHKHLPDILIRGIVPGGLKGGCKETYFFAKREDDQTIHAHELREA